MLSILFTNIFFTLCSIILLFIYNKIKIDSGMEKYCTNSNIIYYILDNLSILYKIIISIYIPNYSSLINPWCLSMFTRTFPHQRRRRLASERTRNAPSWGCIPEEGKNLMVQSVSFLSITSAGLIINN